MIDFSNYIGMPSEEFVLGYKPSKEEGTVTVKWADKRKIEIIEDSFNFQNIIQKMELQARLIIANKQRIKAYLKKDMDIATYFTFIFAIMTPVYLNLFIKTILNDPLYDISIIDSFLLPTLSGSLVLSIINGLSAGQKITEIEKLILFCDNIEVFRAVSENPIIFEQLNSKVQQLINKLSSGETTLNINNFSRGSLKKIKFILENIREVQRKITTFSQNNMLATNENNRGQFIKK